MFVFLQSFLYVVIKYTYMYLVVMLSQANNL
jgi:hypothetical protein